MFSLEAGRLQNQITNQRTAYLLSFDYIKLHSFSISNTAKIFSRVVLFDGCLKS